MPPSEFIRLMKMSTEERLQATKNMHTPKITALLDMAENTLQKHSNVDVDNALFQPFPSEIYFQNFDPTKTYEVALTLRNNDSVSRRMTMRILRTRESRREHIEQPLIHDSR